jgi:hypothetical protein
MGALLDQKIARAVQGQRSFADRFGIIGVGSPRLTYAGGICRTSWPSLMNSRAQ